MWVDDPARALFCYIIISAIRCSFLVGLVNGSSPYSYPSIPPYAVDGIGAALFRGSRPGIHPCLHSLGIRSSIHQALRPAILCNTSQGIPIMWTTDRGPPPLAGAAAALSTAPAGSGTTLLAAGGVASNAHLTWKKVPGWPTPMKRVEMTPGQALARSVCGTKAVYGSTVTVGRR